jgi:ribonuclease BN (tRNA processing enzyme)
MLDGGPGATPCGKLDAWLVTDEHAELIQELRSLAKTKGAEIRVGAFAAPGFKIEPHDVVHTSHPTYGYLIRVQTKRIVWAPEFFEFPAWAKRADLMFAEAAGWNRPIFFAKRTGGHSAALEVAREAEQGGVRRLVFAHIGRPTIRVIDAGQRPPFGEFGIEGRVYRVRMPA